MNEGRTRVPARPRAAPAERLFLAVPIPGDVRDAIRLALPPKLPGRVVRPEHWHLTLRFLGDATAATRETLAGALARAAEGSALGDAFTLRFANLGAFPSAARARVLWLGASEGARECEALAERVEAVVRAAGFGPAVRAFGAHLTLSRLDPPRSVAPLVARPTEVAAPLEVRAVALYRSDLTPQGPRHEMLLEVPLVVRPRT